MAVTSKRQIASLLHERRRAMGGCRFKPENYHEIHRVLGTRYAPDLNRVVSKHRANAASAYMRRLHRDVERAQEGYYDQLQTIPLQIRRMPIRKEDPRSFKSLLIPKLVPVKDPAPSPRSRKSVSPVPPLVVANGSSYVPHKYFSPTSHTHIHVLFKQMPGSVTPRKGTNSIASSEKSGGSSSTEAKSHKSKSLKTSKLSPREDVNSKSPEDVELPTWPVEDMPQPYALPKFTASQPPLPHIKKRLSVDRSPRTERQNPVAGPSKSEESSPVNQFASKEAAKGGLPPNVAAALAAGSSTSALYKLDLPLNLAASYDKNLPAERPKAMVLGSKARFPLPSIPSNSLIGNELLAIVSVQHSNAIQAAA